MSLNLKDLRKKSDKELKDMLKKLSDEVKDALAAVLDGSSKDTGRARRLRKDIARIKTVLNEEKVLDNKNESEEENA